MASTAASFLRLLPLLVVGGGAQGGFSFGGYAQYYQQYMGGGSQGGASSNGAYQQYYQQYIPGGSAQGASAGYEQYYQTYLQQVFPGADKKQAHSVDTSSALAKDKTVVEKTTAAENIAAEKKREQEKQLAAENAAEILATEKKKKQERQAAAEKAAAAAKAAEETAARLEKEAAKKAALVGSVDLLAFMPSTFLPEVSSCTTTTCVQDWRKKHEAEIKKFVPQSYQKLAIASIEKKCKQMIAQIAADKNATSTASPDASSSTLSVADVSELVVVPPMVLTIVSSCSTKKCVREWHNTTETAIKKFVPKDHQHFPLAMVEKEYESNLARVEAVHGKATKQNSFLAALRQESQTNNVLSFASLVLLSLVIGFSVVRFRARQGVPALEEDLLRHPAMLAA